MTEQELNEEQQEQFASMDVVSYITDLILFDYITKENGYVEVTEEDAEKVNEIRKTRMVEFASEMNSEGKKKITARFIYIGEEKDEEDSDNN